MSARAEGDMSQTTTRRRKGVGGKALVAFQIALSTLLVMARDCSSVRWPGWVGEMRIPTDHLLLGGDRPAAGPYPAGQGHPIAPTAGASICGVPGVIRCRLPWTLISPTISSSTDFLPEGREYDPGTEASGRRLQRCRQRFFATLGIPISPGGLSVRRTRGDRRRLGLSTESLARNGFPDRDPIGKRFETEPARHADGSGLLTGAPVIRLSAYAATRATRSCGRRRRRSSFCPMSSRFGGHNDLRDSYADEPGSTLAGLPGHAGDRSRFPVGECAQEDHQIDADTQQERLFVTLTSGFSGCWRWRWPP